MILLFCLFTLTIMYMQQESSIAEYDYADRRITES